MASLHSSSWFSSLRIKPNVGFVMPPTTTLKPSKLCSAVNNDNAESEAQKGPVDPVKLALSRAKAYKESIKSNAGLGTQQNGAAKDNSVEGSNVVDDGGQKKDVPVSVKIALEKAKKYKQNKGGVISETAQGNEGNLGETVKDNGFGKSKKGELSVSKIDFVGLGFADKKQTRGLPPGLVPVSDPFSDGDYSEVEFIVGDASKFDAATAPEPEQTDEDESELYKPKVSTWGVFPRPSNISKTFGGGKVLRPGEILETEEEKAIKQARTKQFIAAYKKKIGLNIDPKLKAECEETLKDGDLLMDEGKLKEALPYYEKIMDKLTFQSELHGLAALQWSICQDSLSRSREARDMYEKLQSHPNPKVNKKAKQFMYSFQAMEMLKVKTGSRYTKNTFYQNYFDAFVENKSNYQLKDDVAQQTKENTMNQVLLYILFLISPLFVVLIIAVQKRI